jgi:2-polyprenyl-3-methyl-5-hydroxy-6-metoxy-1,4-benzoquinol methylase
MKYDKESYITANYDPVKWKNHVNVKTLEEHSNLLVGSVLDIGCNHGSTTYWLKDFNVTKITGIDINNESLTYAKRLFKDIEIPNNFINLDLTKKILDETFDTVICFHTLEHIYPEDVDDFLTNIYSMLKFNGYIILGLPYEHAYSDPCHVAFYNEQSLIDIMTKNSFEPVECFKDDRWNEKNILTGIFIKK